MHGRFVGSTPTRSTKFRVDGVTGSRAGLRSQSRKGCRFDSDSAHHLTWKLDPDILYLRLELDEGGNMSETHGRTWKNERYLASYFEADMLRRSLLLRNEGFLEVKVKRCGEGGNMYVVKSRSLVSENTEAVKEKKNKKAKE